MVPTMVMLPVPLKERAKRRAQQLGISLGEFVRDSIEMRLKLQRNSRSEDPLFADRRVWHGHTPPDLVARFDDYLYGEAE